MDLQITLLQPRLNLFLLKQFQLFQEYNLSRKNAQSIMTTSINITQHCTAAIELLLSGTVIQLETLL